MKKSVLLFGTMFLVACGGAEDAETTMDETEAAEPAMSAEEAAAEETLQQLAERYAEPAAAEADGFMQDPSGMCVTADMVGLPAEQGAMGVHYLHPERLGLVEDAPRPDGTDGVIAWDQPEVLVYEPQEDGSMELVGIEYLVFMDPWEEAGNEGAPEYFGEPFIGMIDDPETEADEAHGFEGHYELHIWTPRANPNGRYAEFNPAVSCEHWTNPSMDQMG